MSLALNAASEPLAPAIHELEPLVYDLRAAATILGALVAQARVAHDLDDEETEAFGKVHAEILDLGRRAVDLWWQASTQHREEIEQLTAEHQAALAAARAERAAPGSAADRERVVAMWQTLRAAVTVAGEACAAAGYTVAPIAAAGAAEPLRW